jgi:hypothetical protein
MTKTSNTGPNRKSKTARDVEDGELREGAGPLDHNAAAAESEDPLVQIDQVLNGWSSRERALVEKDADAKARKEEFLQEFESISQQVIRPSMDAVIERLRKDGGDGLIQERGSDASHSPRLILWMSLAGEVSSQPRQDRNPFLQLDVDVTRCRVDVWEGDMWEKQGNSGAVAPWELTEISPESVTERIIGILQRAATHGSAA